MTSSTDRRRLDRFKLQGTFNSPISLKTIRRFVLQFDLLTQSVVFGAGLFLVCMFCHGELVAAKPDPRHLGRFYAIVSLGGALGSAVGFLALDLGKTALGEALPIFVEDALDARDVAQIIAEADDHARPRLPGLTAGMAASSGGSASAG